MSPHSIYTVRFPDCDPFGHLNNARYIDYFLNAREDHLRDAFGIELHTYARQGVGWVVSGHQIQYLRPAAYNEQVRIESDLIEAGDSNLLVELRMYSADGRQLKAVLWSQFTCIDPKTGKKQKHPEHFAALASSLVIQGIKTSDGFDGRVAGLVSAIKPF